MNLSRSGIVTLFKKSLLNGHARSIKAKKNIIGGVFIKGTSILISLVLVPLTIGYVDASRYGIWLTLSSIVAWFSFFNIGLTQGLRNKFAEALAAGEHDLAQTYVSTTYALLGAIFLAIWLVFLPVHFFIDWSTILNTSPAMESDVSLLALIVFTYFCLQFVLRIITTILMADQQPAKSSLVDLGGQVISLIFIFLLVRFTEGSLVRLGTALCLSPILVLSFTNFLLFRGTYRRYRPKLSKVKLSEAKDLFNLGAKFFVIQVANIIQFQTANVLIANNFGTAEVTSYNIVYRYFNVLNMGLMIFLTPFWSASTEAFMKGELDWIKNAMKKYNYLGILLFCAGLVMLTFSDDVYRLWLGEGTVDISFTLSMWGFIYFTGALFASKYVFFLNGISALRIQFVISIFSPFLFVGLTILFINYYQMGVHSLFIASLISGFNGFLVAPIQYYLIVHRSKKGIWIK